MRFSDLSTTLSALVILASCFVSGCARDISRDQFAQKIGQPGDIQFFGDRAVYMGDQDGYRYVHVRDLFDFWGFMGECDYKVAESEWPMKHPMPLTCDATRWQNVEWMNGDAPAGVPQSAFLRMTPAFPLGAPKTQPTTMPTTTP